MKIRYIIAGLLSLTSLSASAYVSSSFFMQHLPYKMYMNPALQPEESFGTFIELPAISTVYASATTGGLTMQDLFEKGSAGKLVPFYSSSFSSRDKLYEKLKNSTNINEELSIPIFGFGFKVSEPGYLTVNLSVREMLSVSVPKDAFRLLMYGMSSTEGVSTYQLGSLSARAHAYLDLSGGYSHRINEHFKVGARIHSLVGVADAAIDVTSLTASLSAQQWTIRGAAQADYNLPGLIATDENGNISGSNFSFQAISAQNYSPSAGLTFDLGFEYKPIENLSISVGLTDLGFLASVKNYRMSGIYDFSFSGTEISLSGDQQLAFTDTLVNRLKTSGTFTVEQKNVLEMMNAKLYAAVEYKFLKNLMSVGVLSKTVFNTRFVDQEVTLAYTIHPCRFIGLMASYSFLSGGGSSMGAGLNISVPGVNLYVVTDYLPLYYSKEAIPYRAQGLNVQAGIVLTFGGRWNKPSRKQQKQIDAALAADKLPEPDFSAAPAAEE